MNPNSNSSPNPDPNSNQVGFFLEQRIGHQLRTAGDATLNDEWAKVRKATRSPNRSLALTLSLTPTPTLTLTPTLTKVRKATSDLRTLFEGVEVRPSLRHRLRVGVRVGVRVRVRDRVRIRA